jgi:predicted DsbA family dithiol-disulfide isomerase
VHAATLSLDVNAFNACLQSDRHLADIDQDAKDAKAVRLTGTPSFIIGKTTSDEISGQVVIGAQPMNKFDAAISRALEQKPAAKKAR